MALIIKSYVPILRWRSAEISALAKLFPQDWENVTPLVEFIMPAPTIDKESRAIIKTPKDKFLDELPYVAKGIQNACGTNAALIDVHLLESEIRASSFKQILVTSEQLNLLVVPVIYIIPAVSTDADEDTRAVAVAHAKSTGSGLCIRIDKSHLYEDTLSALILNFLKTNELEPESVDILVDLRVVDESVSAEDVARQLEKIPAMRKWRSFILSGGVFPKDLTNFPPGDVHSLARFDLKLWKDIKKKQLPRVPQFSDYTIQHPFYVYVAAIGSASVRYTGDSEWWIFRGTKPGYINKRTKEKGPGREQYIAHAQTLVRRDFYKKKDYSFGDTEIARIAAPGNTKPGSPTTWLTIGINHHITLTARQIASHDENSAKHL